jgi:CRISPR type IV-associated protein Csf2
MSKEKIEARLQLTSPLFIASAEKKYADNLKGKPVTKFTKSGQATGVMKMGIHVDPERRKDTGKGGEGDNYNDYALMFPIIPSNSIRGRLRRKAAMRILDALEATDQRVGLETIHVLTCGASSGRPNGTLSLDDRDRQRNNAYFAAFGGGPKMMRSGFQVATGFPITSDTVASSVVPESMEEHAINAPAWSLTTGLNFRRVDDVLDMQPTVRPEVIRDYPQAAQEWLSLLQKNKDELQKARAQKDSGATVTATDTQNSEDSGEVKKVGLKDFHMMEVVIPGISFYFDIRFLPGLPDAAAGLLVSALADVLAEPIGGKSSGGFGRFVPVVTVGGEPMLDGDGEPNYENPVIASWLEQYDEWLSNVSAEELESFARGE